MTGFFLQNTAGLLVGAGAGTASYYLLPQLDHMTLGTIAMSGYLGAHIPNIQQPTLPSYRIIRAASWLAILLIPLSTFSYRPTDLLVAWLIGFLFVSGFWGIFNRISLRRDFTRSITGIALLPLLITGCVYLGLGKIAVLPTFLASSCGYVLFLLIDHLTQKKAVYSLPSAQNRQPNIQETS